MELQVETITRETIKPSTPTPSHLRSHKLCLLDQLSPLSYVPLALFYKNNTTNQLSTSLPSIVRLKESLAKALSIFYPLAGRLTADESTVDCNDKGISFVEARANCSLISFLEDPNRLTLVDRFIPNDIYDKGDEHKIISSSVYEPGSVTELILAIIQVTVFECGGLAIGFQRLHKILDGNSLGVFLKTWATLAAGRDKDLVPPDFSSATSLFPPCSWAAIDPHSSIGRRPVPMRPLEDNDCGHLVKAFAFTPQAISALQAKARSDSVPSPTRVEVVSGFIWKHGMLATTRAGLSVPLLLTHGANMRSVIDPPIPTAIGNLNTRVSAFYHPQEQAMELPHLVAEIRKAVLEAKDPEFISKLQGEGGATAVREHDQELPRLFAKNNIKKFRFTSWTRLGLNADFGFGPPVWIGFIGGRLSYEYSFIPLIQTPDNNGIEAWVPLDDKVMELLLSDSEFLSFASPIN